VEKRFQALALLSNFNWYRYSAAPLYGVQRAMYDGFAMSFQTLLKADSAAVLERLMVKHLLKGTPLKVRLRSRLAQAVLRAFWVHKAGNVFCFFCFFFVFGGG
jgi:midasin (ATPase involved in ribosome maturation)